MDDYYTAEGKRAKYVWPMDDQTGEQQDDDRDGLQPVPEATVGIVHVNTIGLRGHFWLSPRVEKPKSPMSGDAQDRACGQERADPVDPVDPTGAENVQFGVGRNRVVVN